jgi:hypothetical protein
MKLEVLIVVTKDTIAFRDLTHYKYVKMYQTLRCYFPYDMNINKSIFFSPTIFVERQVSVNEVHDVVYTM